MIYRCFNYAHAGDVPKFLKKFKSQLQDNTQVMHTFRELILGAYLTGRGFNVRYEYTSDGETPDWSALNESAVLIAIVELINFHLDLATADSIDAELLNRGYWIGWQTSNDVRLYERIQHKMNAYKTLVKKHDIPYVVAVFGEFRAAVNRDELNTCLYSSEYGLFELNREVSGVLFFEESSGRYQFTYMPNPNPLIRLDIPDGSFS